MAPGGPRPALLLLLALLPAGQACWFASRSAQDFVARHVDFPRTSPPPGQQYCDYLMRQWRSLPGTLRRPFTFVHADPSQLASLCRCGDGSQPPARTCVSRDPISTTTCYRGFGGLGGFGGLWGLRGYGGWGGDGCKVKGRCPYVGWIRRRRIRVACRSGEPVGILGTV